VHPASGEPGAILLARARAGRPESELAQRIGPFPSGPAAGG
jgi:hypothetical protein